MLSPVTCNFLKNFFHNRVYRKKYPFFGSIEMTRRCNSKCLFCPIGCEKDELVRGEMKIEEIFRVLDQFAELRIIAFSYLGGEPTLRKDVCEVADYANKLNIKSQLTTNGILVADRAEAYTRSLDAIVISLDATDADTYRAIRNIDAFDNVVSAFQECVKYSRENDCAILSNTVICSKNIEQIPEVIKFCSSLGVDGIMLEFATFHDNWKGIVKEDSAYAPDEMDWRHDVDKLKKMIPEVIAMKKKYPIITSTSYLKTFLLGDFHFKCYPYLFCCVDKNGMVSVPCFDSLNTKLCDIINEHDLKELMFSDETAKAREAVKDCDICYMHCIVEPSKVLGEPLHHCRDLFEWIRTFQRHSGKV
jgi:MoaA/NifB/PqqE/SkfB family radical SAM enzyme